MAKNEIRKEDIKEEIKEIKEEIKVEPKKKKYIANARLEINGKVINIGEEVENFTELRDRTQTFLLNLRRVKVIEE